MQLSVAEALSLRAAAQGLTAPLEGGPTAVVERFGALQGQDFRAVRTAIALRSGSSEDDVRRAFADGELVRGWPMRGTLFATSPLFLASVLAVTAERVQRSATRRRAEIGLTDEVLERAKAIGVEALRERPLSRAQLTALWADAGMEVHDGRAYHLIFHHSIDGVWHWGALAGDQPALVLTADPDQPLLGLGALVEIYLRGHGPATVDDLAFWFKLPKGQLRAALAEIDVVEVEVDHPTAGGSHVVLPETLELAPPPLTETWHLPPFDEWFLGYDSKSRDLICTPEVRRDIVPGLNGVFRPIVVDSGQVVATWTR